MGEVAYLLGAGASAGCIPVVNNMEESIGLLLTDLHPFEAKFRNSVYGEERSAHVRRTEYCTGVLKRLQAICKEYFSIDTYAKKLYLTDIPAFDILKKELCFYFTLVQMMHSRDKRYDNFFASVINEYGKLPPRVKVISWNYDFQLELSHTQFTKEKDLFGSRKLLNMVSPENYKDFSGMQHQFSVIKLNGSASFRTDSSIHYLGENLGQASEENIAKLYEEFNSLMNGDLTIVTDLKFAWEMSDIKSVFEVYQPELSKIEVVVVIGYSFPYFNRNVDIALFSAMANLKKIYIQDVEPEKIKELMVEFVNIQTTSILAMEYVGKTNLSQFVFPKELDTSGPAGHPLSTIF